MLFCPNCANFLVISDTTGVNRWVCQTCAYQFPITKQVRHIFHSTPIIPVLRMLMHFRQMTSRIQPEKKKVDDVIDSRVNFEGQPKVECEFLSMFTSATF